MVSDWGGELVRIWEWSWVGVGGGKLCRIWEGNRVGIRRGTWGGFGKEKWVGLGKGVGSDFGGELGRIGKGAGDEITTKLPDIVTTMCETLATMDEIF